MTRYNYQELAMVDVARILLTESTEPLELTYIFKEVAKLKGFSTNNITKINQLYTDLVACGEFVYVGENKWGLKERNLDFIDKDGTAFAKEIQIDSDLDEEIIDDDDLDFSDYKGGENIEDYYDDEEAESLLDEDEEEELLDSDDDYENDQEDEDEGDESEDSEYDFDDEDSYDDSYDDDDDDDLSQYNKYMDDYEEMYD